VGEFKAQTPHNKLCLMTKIN